MKADTVRRVVDAVGDSMEMRALADKEANTTNALQKRVAALESLLGVVCDALLEGTSADPAAGKPATKAAKGKK